MITIKEGVDNVLDTILSLGEEENRKFTFDTLSNGEDYQIVTFYNPSKREFLLIYKNIDKLSVVFCDNKTELISYIKKLTYPKSKKILVIREIECKYL